MLILMLGFFVILVSDVVAPPLVALEGVHSARDGAKFTCKVHGCNVTYIAKYNLVWHLQIWQNVIMELGKFRHPSIWEEASKHQDHVVMNANLWSGFVIMKRRQLLRLGGMQTCNGINSRFFCETHLRFLSPHLLN